MGYPLISVIVPIYKVENYIHRCVNSLINQTYKNMEIILVDDGSPDKCPDICDEYHKKYENIIVLHKQNGGLSSARNAGLAVARGEYIGFIDSDDWVTPDMYQYCYDLITISGADAVQVGYHITGSETELPKQKNEKIEVFTGKEILQYYMSTSTKTGSYSVWKCLYKRSVLDGLTFREGKINEDIDFNYRALSNCQKFCVSNQKKYFYFQSGDSLSSGGLKKKDFDLYDAAEELCVLASNETYGTIKYLCEVKKARTAMSLLCKIAYYGIADPSINRKDVLNKLIREHKRNTFLLLTSPIPFSRKCLSAGFYISYPLTESLIRLVRRMQNNNR